MLKPMPSPNGTNIERLFILKGRASNNPVAAYDSARQMTPAQAARYGAEYARRMTGGPRLAYDAVTPEAPAAAGNADAVNTIVTWALGNLTPADLDKLVAAIGRERNMSLDGHRRHAMDAHRPSRGMSSAAHASFHELFPDAARIKTL